MNIKRGLFRVWLVLSVMFIAAVAIIGGSQLPGEFERLSVFAEIPENGQPLVPVPCKSAEGILGTDYELSQGKTEKADADKCWYTLASFKKNFPKAQGHDDEEIVKDLYEAADIPLNFPTPWWTIASLAAWAFGVPLFFLSVGAAIYWAFAGFARSSQPRA